MPNDTSAALQNPPDDLEGRVMAHRRVIQWLLHRDNGALLEELRHVLGPFEDNIPPLDHQEDPGAVPTAAFGAFAAYTAEMRLLLEPPDAADKTA
jgi:hypothetical protein